MKAIERGIESKEGRQAQAFKEAEEMNSRIEAIRRAKEEARKHEALGNMGLAFFWLSSAQKAIEAFQN